MKYIFFDVECASCENGRGRLYSLGYMITDENFNIIENEKDILINPSIEKWDWYVVKKMMAYPKKEVQKYPKFDEQYNRIKSLLEDDSLVFGYNVTCDVSYVLDECERYNLEPIKINYFDVQRLEIKASGKRKSLGKAYELWCKNVPTIVHRSDADARLTFELAKEICKSKQKTIQEFMEEDESLFGRTDGFKYGFNDEELRTKAEREASRDEDKLKRYIKKKIKKGFRKLNEEKTDYLVKGSKNNFLFARHIRNVVPKTIRAQTLKDKKVSLSKNYETYHYANMMNIVQLICDCGGKYVRKATEADLFVRYHLIKNGEEEPCSKYEHVQKDIERGKEINVVEFEEFLKMLGTTEEELNALPTINYEYLLDGKYNFENQYKGE